MNAGKRQTRRALTKKSNLQSFLEETFHFASAPKHPACSSINKISAQLQNFSLCQVSKGLRSPQSKFLTEALKFMKHALDLGKKVGDLRGLRWKPLQFIPEIHLQPS